MTPKSLLIVPLALVALVSCSSSGGGSGTHYGVLSGTATPCFGPVGFFPKGITYTVKVTDGNGNPVTSRAFYLNPHQAQVETPVAFSFTLPVGRYTADGGMGSTQTVAVTAHHTSQVKLIPACT